MKIIYLSLFVVLIFAGCRHERDKSSNLKQPIAKPQLRSHPSDTLIIDHKAAVGAMVSHSELEKRRKEYGDTAFYVGADDDNYYSFLTDSFLKQKKLPVLSADGYKYLKFIQRNGEKTTIKIDTLPALINMYFFDPVRSPQLVDETDIEDAYKNYFQ
jgi:hypothetical protein